MNRTRLYNPKRYEPKVFLKKKIGRVWDR